MNCHDAQRYWDLFHDSEGDADLHFQLNDHLENCAACAEWFHKQSRLELLIKERLAGDAEEDASAVDWSRILAGAGVAPAIQPPSWGTLGIVLVALAAGIMLRIGFAGGFRPGGSSNLAHLSAEVHQHVLAGSLRPEFESESDIEVDRYLVNRVPFPVRCPPRKDSGFAVRGAGLCQLSSQSAAYVVGSVDQQPVSIFVLPKESLKEFPGLHQVLQREPMAACREGNSEMVLSVFDDNLVLVIGNVERTKLTRVLKSYGTYPHAA